MSNSNTAKKARPTLRVIQGTGNPKAATLEDLQKTVKVMNYARANGIDMQVQLHVGATTIDVTNKADAPAGVAVADAAVIVKMPANRFTKVSKEGKALPASATDWEGVYDAETGLIWGRSVLPGDTRNWKDAMKAANEATLCGAPARAPTIQERTGITAYDKHSPALPDVFVKETGWEWTSTVDAESPSDYAWIVYLGYGNANRYYHSNRNHVRAVRSGQPIGL